MKLQQLRYLTTVVEAGSLTEAARRLNVSQPALSAGLGALETELGGSVIERQRGSIRLTPLGARFHRRALGIVNECERAKVEFRRGLSRSRVEIGVLSTISMDLVLAFVADFAKAAPSIEVSIREGDPMTLLSWLSRGRIDAAVTVSDLVEGGDWAQLFQDPLALVCPHGHRLARQSAIRLTDLEDEPFILRGQCERRREADDILAARGVRLPVVLRTEQDQHAFDAVRAGIGVTIAPRSLARDTRALPIDDFGLSRTVGVHLTSWLEPAIGEPLVACLHRASHPFVGSREPDAARRTDTRTSVTTASR